jgi:integrase
LTVGQYVQQASKHSGASVRSVASYAKALRSICASLLGADANQAKYGRGRAGRKWRQEIDDMALASLTPERIREWKADYLQRGKQDPISKRSRKVSVNSLMRLAKSLFSKSILKNIGLPIVDPFADIEFEARQNTKYRGTFDARSLFEAAQAELAGVDPEAFKAFLLGLCAGLRRHEIDLLEWSSFRWREGVVRIETTEHFTAKSEDSLGDVALDPDVLELFKGYQTRASSEFVIESPFAPRPEARYSHYRCEPVFKRLGSWLKAHGIRARKPLHELRKEFGAILCNTPAGIYGASQMLRHSSVKITEMHYAQHRARITVSFSRPANVVAISEETNNLTSQAV